MLIICEDVTYLYLPTKYPLWVSPRRLFMSVLASERYTLTDLRSELLPNLMLKNKEGYWLFNSSFDNVLIKFLLTEYLLIRS